MRTMDFKAVVLKAGKEGTEDDGRVRALVSVFNNIDSYGDVVVDGAFAKNLQEWEAKGDPIPFIWSHDWQDPFSHVGVVEKAVEGEADGKTGLIVDAYISPEERAANPKAAQVWRLLKARRVTQFSFAFDVVDGGWGTRTFKSEAGDELEREVYELRELKVLEVGPCLLGVNSETELIAAKAARLTRGEELTPGARKNLSAALDSITAALRGPQEPPANPEAAAGGSQATPAKAADVQATQPADDAAKDPDLLARARTLLGRELLADTNEN